MKPLRYTKLIAASAFALMISGGCASMNAGGTAAADSGQGSADLKAAASASKASQKAAAKGRYDEAVTLAENAVMAAPEEAAYRARLGEAYQQAGRFASAEQAYAEARVLGDSSVKTLIGHSLALSATGKVDDARNLLTENRTELPASDYGLALALAGDTDLAARVLEDAIRNGQPSQRTRQNLGFTYAMAGRWREAQLVVQRDLGDADLRDRLSQWAQLARPGAYEQRVASILGVTPDKNDAGMPVLLALNSDESDDLSLAGAQQVAPSPYGGASLATVQLSAIAEQAAQKIELAEPDMTVNGSAAALAVAKPASLPANYVPNISSATQIAPKPAQIASAAPSIAQKAAKVDVNPLARPVTLGSQYVVQIGAYADPKNAERAWALNAKRYPVLQKYAPADASVKLKGKELHRVAASGIESAGEAREICRNIRKLGGECIVRPVAGFTNR